MTPTTTTLTANPSPANTGQTVTLTATEAPATAGSVDFKNGAADLGSVAVNGSGVATMTTSFAAAGTREPDSGVHAHRHRRLQRFDGHGDADGQPAGDADGDHA